MGSAKYFRLSLSENKELLKVFKPWYTIRVSWTYFLLLNMSICKDWYFITFFLRELKKHTHKKLGAWCLYQRQSTQ